MQIGLNSSNARGLAYVNHGRWLVDCPFCGSPILFHPETEKTIVCGACHPALLSMKLVPIPGDPEHGLRPVPDAQARVEARKTATEHPVVVPKNWKEIYEVLRLRPTHLMNWLPGESIERLKAENIEHGIGRVKS